jgi:hypothetical protein
MGRSARGTPGEERLVRISIPIYRIRSSQLHHSQIRSIGVLGSRTRYRRISSAGSVGAYLL